jgi:hypothetical protein
MHALSTCVQNYALKKSMTLLDCSKLYLFYGNSSKVLFFTIVAKQCCTKKARSKIRFSWPNEHFHFLRDKKPLLFTSMDKWEFNYWY